MVLFEKLFVVSEAVRGRERPRAAASGRERLAEAVRGRERP